MFNFLARATECFCLIGLKRNKFIANVDKNKFSYVTEMVTKRSIRIHFLSLNEEERLTTNKILAATLWETGNKTKIVL